MTEAREALVAEKELASIDLEGLDLTGEEFNFDDVDGEATAAVFSDRQPINSFFSSP